MPFVRIDTQKGCYSSDQREAIGECIYLALRGIGVPEEDRFQVFSEKQEGELRYGRNYLGIDRTAAFVAIQITMNAGRTLEQKKALFAAIANGLAREVGARREDVFVNLIEVPKENWSFGNGEAQYAPKVPA